MNTLEKKNLTKNKKDQMNVIELRNTIAEI